MLQEAENSDAVYPKFTNKYRHLFMETSLHLTYLLEYTLYICYMSHESRRTQAPPEFVSILSGRTLRNLLDEAYSRLFENSHALWSPRAVSWPPARPPKCRILWRIGVGQPRRPADYSAAPGRPTCPSAWTRTQFSAGAARASP